MWKTPAGSIKISLKRIKWLRVYINRILSHRSPCKFLREPLSWTNSKQLRTIHFHAHSLNLQSKPRILDPSSKNALRRWTRVWWWRLKARIEFKTRSIRLYVTSLFNWILRKISNLIWVAYSKISRKKRQRFKLPKYWKNILAQKLFRTPFCWSKGLTPTYSKMKTAPGR